MKRYMLLFCLFFVACSQSGQPAPTTAPEQAPEPTTAPVATQPNRIIGNEAVIEGLEIAVGETESQAVVRGNLPSECLQIEQITQQLVGNGFGLVLTTSRPEGGNCPEQPILFEELVTLATGSLPAGTYEVVASSGNTVRASFELGDEVAVVEEGEAGEATAVPPTSTPQAQTSPGYIAGVIWHDFCELAGGGLSENCVGEADGNYGADGVFNTGEGRIDGVEVTLQAGACPGSDQAAISALTDGDGTYQFTGLQAGEYCVSVDAQSANNAEVLLPGEWTFPADSASVTVNVIEGQATRVDFAWDYQLTGTPLGVVCNDNANFIADVNIPDDTILAPNENFVKTWRLKNIGGCAWDLGYQVVFAEGDQMGGEASPIANRLVQPEEEIEVSVELTAPAEAGTYRGFWQLQSSDGTPFSVFEQPFYVQIVVNETGEQGTVETGEATETDEGTETGEEPVGSGDGTAVIRGVIWDDYCEEINDAPVGNCLDNGAGGYRANGRYEPNERRIEGVEVTLGQGTCDASSIFGQTQTNAEGEYRFDTLEPGDYCVFIFTGSSTNTALLMPGQWTFPQLDVNTVSVTVSAGEERTVDFGWDYALR